MNLTKRVAQKIMRKRRIAMQSQATGLLKHRLRRDRLQVEAMERDRLKKLAWAVKNGQKAK